MENIQSFLAFHSWMFWFIWGLSTNMFGKRKHIMLHWLGGLSIFQPFDLLETSAVTNWRLAGPEINEVVCKLFPPKAQEPMVMGFGNAAKRTIFTQKRKRRGKPLQFFKALRWKTLQKLFWCLLSKVWRRKLRKPNQSLAQHFAAS